MADPSPLEAMRAGGKRALARALARIESAPEAEDALALLDAAYLNPTGHTLGLTGPPGVGKSTLTDALVKAARTRGLTVGVIAVDPSSMRSGGALLGDRARLASIDPMDQGVFVRSMATRGRLGGLAALTWPAMTLMRAIYDLVLVETVGVGQSEIEVGGLVDAVMLCIQPASGDSLQFMKAGVMEIPDLAVVTKSDLGATARRAAADLRAAMAASGGGGLSAAPEVLLVSAARGDGVEDILEALFGAVGIFSVAGSSHDARSIQAKRWLHGALLADYGARGAAAAGVLTGAEQGDSPFRSRAELASRLDAALAKLEI